MPLRPTTHPHSTEICAGDIFSAMAAAGDKDNSELSLSQLEVRLLTGINKLRATSSTSGASDFEPFSKREGAFAELFDIAFVKSHHGDDLLFYVPSTEKEGNRKRSTSFGKAASTKTQSERLQVFRKGAAKPLPKLRDPGISWEQTVCLNTIMQHVTYTLTVALCRTSPSGRLSPVHFWSKQVYASPSYRAMDSKSAGDVITYPKLFFTVDDFDEAFDHFEVSPKLTFSIELMATLGPRQTVLINGSVMHSGEQGGLVAEFIRYQGQKQPASAWLHIDHDNLVFFQIQAPGHDAGYVEMALAPVINESGTKSPPSGSASNAPTSSLLGSLWRGTGKALGAARALATMVGGSNTPSKDTLEKVNFKTFVTYASLPWQDVIDKITSSQPQPPRLHQLHQRHQQRKDASAASSPVGIVHDVTPTPSASRTASAQAVPGSPERTSTSAAIMAHSPAKDVVDALRQNIRERSQSAHSST
eukprot:TRINITY_DN4814_c0_g1_i1.p1 TRINITY_DN4814_c0_g1~~TRINITY_DN4814_c0_g1_i1.p1  ORF type:complete len:474 (+),score=103.59 TRINITY_DN4814_c0_g1_i1:23-1444(+)